MQLGILGPRRDAVAKCRSQSYTTSSPNPKMGCIQSVILQLLTHPRLHPGGVAQAVRLL